MLHIWKILKFGWPYMRRYWTRFAAGILLGVLFGLSNASFVWATKTLFERLAPAEKTSAITLTNAGPAELSWAADGNVIVHPPGGQLSAGTAVEVTLTPKPVTHKKGEPAASIRQTIKEHAQVWNDQVRAWIDPWMPLMGRKPDWRQLLGGFLFLPVLVATRSFLGYLSSYCMNWVSERMMNDLRYDVLSQFYRLSLDFFNRSTIGDLLTRINTDTSVLHKTMTNGLSDIVKEPFTLIGVLAGLCWMDWKMTLVAVVFLPLCIVPLVVLGKKIRRATKASLHANISQSSLLVEAINGIRVVKAFGLEADSLERFRQYCKSIIHHDMKSVQARELVNPLVETISMLGLGFLIMFIFMTGTQIGDLAGFLTGIILVFAPVKKLAGVHVLFQQASVGVDRLDHVLKEKPTVAESPTAAVLKPFARDIRFENVSFAYADRLVLKDFSLTVPRGHKLGIAGLTGSGKSTLVNLLFRFYDVTGGTVKVDGTDLRDLSVLSLREQMALVSQEIVIFDQTVAENIACGRKGATQAEVEAAAKAAFAHEFIIQLKDGYQTRVGERGVTLSGGQRQRIAIARAFVRNAPILVLDEATGSLDSKAEAEVQAAIDRLEQNRTVVCVAHRLSTLAAMDRIIVLVDGRIIESGTFEELLRMNGTFADMARRQGITPGSNG